MAASVRVLAFAGARDVLGTHELELDLADVGASPTAAKVLDVLCARWPALGAYRSAIRLAVNGEYAAADVPVGAGDEVALIPPVAGG
jgi:sulfur-carrier protein